jgi:hypothetical protein
MFLECKEDIKDFEDVVFINVSNRQKNKNIKTDEDIEDIISINNENSINKIKDNLHIEDGEVLLVFEINKYLNDVQSSFKSWEEIVKQYIIDFNRIDVYHNGLKQIDPLFLFNHLKIIHNPLQNHIQTITKLKLNKNLKTLMMLINQASYGYIYEKIHTYYNLNNNDKILTDSKEGGLLYNIVSNNNQHNLIISKVLSICKPEYNDEGFFLDFNVYKTLNIDINLTLTDNKKEKYGVLSWKIR